MRENFLLEHGVDCFIQFSAAIFVNTASIDPNVTVAI
jgi:hypothetical protein